MIRNKAKFKAITMDKETTAVDEKGKEEIIQEMIPDEITYPEMTKFIE
jgi:hypothetical protein